MLPTMHGQTNILSSDFFSSNFGAFKEDRIVNDEGGVFIAADKKTDRLLKLN